MYSNTKEFPQQLLALWPKMKYKSNQRSFCSSWVFDEPVNDYIYVYRVLAWNHIAADLSLFYWLKSSEITHGENAMLHNQSWQISIYIYVCVCVCVDMTTLVSRTYSWSTNACLERASDLSILFPRTSKGIPPKEGFVNSSCNSLREIGTLSLSAASTTYLSLHPLMKGTEE